MGKIEGGWDIANRCLFGGGLVGDPFEDPFEDTGIFSVAGPEVSAVWVFPEPVDVVDPGQVTGTFTEREPVGKVVPHMVAAEWEHRERVVAEFADLPFGCGGHFGGDASAEEHPVLPGERLKDEGDDRVASAAKDNGGDGDPMGVVGFW